MSDRRVGIIGAGLASLAMLAASEAISRGEPLPPLPIRKKPVEPRAKSASLQRMLRKAKP